MRLQKKYYNFGYLIDTKTHSIAKFHFKNLCQDMKYKEIIADVIDSMTNEFIFQNIPAKNHGHENSKRMKKRLLPISSV